MVRVFCSECDRLQPVRHRQTTEPREIVGWWVSTDGDLFTDCPTCDDAHTAYAVTRYLDGRDLRGDA